MLSGEDLAAFVAIASHRHFVRAADALGTTQSVISKRLARLEDQIGTRLIERGNRKSITLTRAGEIFLPEAGESLARLDRAERIGRKTGMGHVGPLRVGYVFSGAMAGILSRLVANCARRYPDLDLQPRLMETPLQLEELEAGQIDVGIVRPRPTYPSGITAQTIHEEPLMIAMASDHRLADHSEIDAGDLAEETFLTPQFREEVGLAEVVADLARSGGFDCPKITTTGDFITAAALAAVDRGVVLAPRSLSRLGFDGLVFRPLSGTPALTVKLVLCWRNGFADDVMQAMAAQLQSVPKPLTDG